MLEEGGRPALKLMFTTPQLQQEIGKHMITGMKEGMLMVTDDRQMQEVLKNRKILKARI